RLNKKRAYGVGVRVIEGQMEAAATAGTAGKKLIGTKKPHLADTSFKISLYVSGGIVVTVLAAILLIMFLGGRQAFETFGLGFIWSAEWTRVTGIYGALPAISGTIITAVIAIVIAWPIGFGIAYFLTETCPAPLRAPLGIAIELLAAIPSIVYGMWGF